MKFLLVALLSLSADAATFRLRYGGSNSAYRITAISNGSPAVVTVADVNNVAQHSLVAGDTIYLHSGQGCPEIWGYQKVASSPAPTTSTFAVVHSDNTPVVCSSSYLADNVVSGQAYVGKYKTVHSYATFPRMMSPQSGAIKDRMIDQRSTGGSISGMATENGVAYRQLISTTTGYLAGAGVEPNCMMTIPPVDGTGDSVCGVEKTGLGNGNVNDGTGIDALALIWQADKTKTNYLQAVRYYLWNIERSIYAYGRNFGWVVDQTAAHGGLSSSTDWISGYVVHVMRAYDIVHDQLTPTEISRFADQMLNGYTGDQKTCTNQLVKMAGTVSSVGIGSPAKTGTITGSGFNTQFAVNDYGLIKNGTSNGVAPKWGAAGTWFKVTAIGSDSSMTVAVAGSSSVIPTATGVDYYHIDFWNQAANHCGAMFAADAHGSYVSDVSPVGLATLTSAVSDTVGTTISVNSTANILDTVPYYIVVESEVMKVTAATPNAGHVDLTVVRGADYSTAATHSSGKTVVWQMMRRNPVAPIGPYFNTGAFVQNLTFQRNLGFASVGLGLAEDDARAVDLFEKSFNYFYDTTYPHFESTLTALTHGGYSTWGYQWGRYQPNIMTLALNGQYSFSDATYPELIGDWLWRGVDLMYYWAQPNSVFTAGPNTPWMPESQYEVKEKVGTSMSWFMLCNTFHPSAECDYAIYWWRNYSIWRTTMGERIAMWVAPYLTDSYPGTDFTTNQKPWLFATTSTYPRANSTLISRSDWTTSASMIMTQPYWVQADHDEMTVVHSPGAMFAHKGGKILIGGNNSTTTGAGTATNIASYVKLGAVKDTGNPWWMNGGSAEGMGHFDRMIGTDSYVYARSQLVDYWDAPVNATRSTRSFLHWKVGGDYVITFDDHATSSNMSPVADWWYPFSDEINYVSGQANTFAARKTPCGTSSIPPTFSYDSVNQIVTFKKPDTCNPIVGIRLTNHTQPAVVTSMVSSQIFFPDGATPTITTPTPNPTTSFAYDWHAAWPATQSAQMITVHKLATGTSDTMPTTSLITADTFSYGLQIDNGSNCLAVAYSKDGADRFTRTVTTTHAGDGQALFTGLAPGDYVTTIDGGAPSAPTTVFADGTLLITANGAHTFAVSNTSVPTLETSTGSMLFNATVGGGNPPNQSVGVICAGCTLDNYSVAKTLSWLSVSPSSGSAAGSFSVSVDVSGQTEGSYSDTLTVSSTTSGITNSPITIPVSIVVAPSGGGGGTGPTITTTDLPDGTYGVSYTSSFSATGGDSPYTYTISSGDFPPGLSLSADGTVSGIPTRSGVFNFGVTATDASGLTSPEQGISMAIVETPTSAHRAGQSTRSGAR